MSEIAVDSDGNPGSILRVHKQRRRIDPLIRFEKFVMPEPNSGCWLWTGGHIGEGYGSFYFNGTKGYAHRFSFLTFNGPIPVGMVIDHKCRVRCCVNPSHLEAVKQGENIIRGKLPTLTTEKAKMKIQCSNGHPYLQGSFKIANWGKRYRICLICRRKAERKRRHIRKESENNVF